MLKKAHVASSRKPTTFVGMGTIAELEEQAMQLPENQRAALAAHLLRSLPDIVPDDDEGIAEAMRRDTELDRDRSSGQTLQEFRKSLGR